jgi:hypothetical protein
MGKRRGGTVATVLNRCAEVGDGRRGGAMRHARAERGRERGGSRSTSGRRPAGYDSRPAGDMAWPVEQGRGKGVDRWAATTVSGGGTG